MKCYKYSSQARISAFLMLAFLSWAPICQAGNFGSTQAVTNANRVAVDNSGQNRGENSVTAGQQGNSPGDINITREIRQSVERSDNLSELAKNVKIITLKGNVTLRGPVNTAAEKNSIGQIARKAAGENNVHNQIAVKNNQ
jgi:hyperosmotically inducible protein